MVESFEQLRSSIDEQIQFIIDENNHEEDVDHALGALHGFLEELVRNLEDFASPTPPRVTVDTQIDERIEISAAFEPDIFIDYYILLLELGYQYDILFEAMMLLWKNFPKFLKQFSSTSSFQASQYLALLTLLLKYCDDGFRILLVHQTKQQQQELINSQYSASSENSDCRRRDNQDENLSQMEEVKSLSTTPSTDFEQSLKLLIFFIQRLSMTLSLGKAIDITRSHFTQAITQLFSFYGFIQQDTLMTLYYPAYLALQRNCFQSLLKVGGLTDNTKEGDGSDIYDYLNIDVWLIYDTVLQSTKEDEKLKTQFHLIGVQSFYTSIISAIADQKEIFLDNGLTETLWKDWIINLLQTTLTIFSIQENYCQRDFFDLKLSLSDWMKSFKKFLQFLQTKFPQESFVLYVLTWLAQHACGYHTKSLLSKSSGTVQFATSVPTIQKTVETEILLSRVILIDLFETIDDSLIQKFLAFVLLEIRVQAESKSFQIIDASVYLEDTWIIQSISMTLISLLYTSSNRIPDVSQQKQNILLQWIYEFLSAHFNSIPGVPFNQNVMVGFPSEIIQHLLINFPFSNLLSAGSPPEIISLTNKIIELVSLYFKGITTNQPTNNAGRGSQKSNLVMIPSFPTLSWAYCLMIALLNSVNQQANHPSYPSLETVQNVIKSFQRNQILSTHIIQEILILMQQYNHYCLFYSTGTTSDSSNCNMKEDLVKKVLPVSSLKKMIEILHSEELLFQLIQYHPLPNGVKMILLQALTFLSAPISSLVEQFLTCLNSNSSSMFPQIMLLLDVFQYSVMIGCYYIQLFLRQDHLQDQQTQVSLVKSPFLFF